MKTDYHSLLLELGGLLDGVSCPVSLLANTSALLLQEMENINWVGFYLAENGRLLLGPFQGKPACTEIPFGRGVCGTSAAEKKTQLVPDVHAFPGHIACDGASRSEIVVPVFRNGDVYGVLDIDSPVPGRFTQEDREGLEAAVRLLEAKI